MPRRTRLVPPGGPSTIHGVLYQALGALATCINLQQKLRLSSPDRLSETAILVLEPANGGDQVEKRGHQRVVTQLKSRSTGAWSLGQVIERVLPDLYQAVDLNQPTTYRFVTNASIGSWDAPRQFFRSLARRPTDEPLTCRLSSAEPYFYLPAGRADGRRETMYSERDLFDRILGHLSSSPKVARESLVKRQRKVWNLLANLVIEPDTDFAATEAQIDRWLLSQVGSKHKLQIIRDALLLDLLRSAQAGNAAIDPRSFFKKHRLNSAPLSDWESHTRSSKAVLAELLARRGFDRAEDVRPSLASSLATLLKNDQLPLVVSGDGGQGKSWLVGAIGTDLAARGELVIQIDAVGDGPRDLQAACEALWRRVLGREEVFPLGQTRNCLSELNPLLANRPIFLIVDDVRTSEEARQLLMEPCDAWGVRLLLAVSTNVATGLADIVAARRATVRAVPDFEPEELRTSLTRALGNHWVKIPDDVRSTLRRPLLCRLYLEMAEAGAWMPRREYELYERVWERFLLQAAERHPMDGVLLAKASAAILQGMNYPWDAEDLCRNWHDDRFIVRLSRSGWLAPRPLHRYAIWHDRLLNWATAVGLVGQYRRGELSLDALGGLLRGLEASDHPQGSLLRYVPLDVLWLLSAPGHSFGNAASVLLSALEDS